MKIELKNKEKINDATTFQKNIIIYNEIDSIILNQQSKFQIHEP